MPTDINSADLVSSIQDGDEFPLNAVGNLDKKGNFTKVTAYIKTIKLDAFAAPTDTTTRDATTSLHGLMPKADKSKLDGIESSATADQTDAEIKTALENNADTNTVTDTEKTAVGNLSGTNTGDEVTTKTDGSVLFSESSALAQDNDKLFWDNTNKRLGVGNKTPLATLHVTGTAHLTHTATENDDHALEMDVNAAGFGDVKAIDIDYISGNIAATEEEEAILVSIDESDSSGGEITGIDVLATKEGSAKIHGLGVGVNVAPIHQSSGTFVDMEVALNKAVDVLAALSHGGAGAISAFLLNTETITIGTENPFSEMEVILGTGASGAGIKPTFEYSTGVGAWATFSPADGTDGFKNTGVILWDVANLAGFAQGTDSKHLIRITRTRVTLTTTPIIDEIQVAATTIYAWDKDGKLTIDTINTRNPTTDGTKLDGIAASANNYVHPNHTGDVTSVADGAQTIAADSVSNLKAANMAANSIKGNDTGGSADPKDLTTAELLALINVSAGAEVNPDVVSQADAEAGTATDERIWTAVRVKQAIDALGGGGSGNTFARIVKKADETIAEDTVFSDDAELKVTLNINKTYHIMMLLMLTSGTTPDFKYTFTLPTGASGDKKISGDWDPFTETSTGDITGTSNIGIGNSNMNTLEYHARVIMGSTAGDVTFQWAQQNTSVVNTTVNEGSLLVVWEET